MFFSKFERLVARRYLKAKRREGFISVITGFAFTGIALGVATLIIVMSVMNGFRHELLSRILGINGHIGIMAVAGVPFNNYPEAVREIGTFEHVQTVIPMIERQLLVSSGTTAEGAMVRGIAKEDLLKKKILKDSLIHVDVDDFPEQRYCRRASGTEDGADSGGRNHADFAERQSDGFRHGAADEILQDYRHFRSRHV